MNFLLKKSTLKQSSYIKVTGSKSESNRVLLLQALYPELSIKNKSNSDDTQLMQNALSCNDDTIDVHHAGTAMRFLTAYFATQNDREVMLTGSSRMQERPIKILVDALLQLGAEISYKKTEGYPPIMIKGKELRNNKVTLKANISSQYISALVLIASKQKHGITITLEGKITSIPYIEMTLALLNQIGITTHFENNKIEVQPRTEPIQPKTLVVESDWSSASYYYSCIALSRVGTAVTLSSYKQKSLQGDSLLITIYKAFGVETSFDEHSITIKKISTNNLAKTFNLITAPDIAQTIAVTCLGLGVDCYLTGLHTLKIKETDRLQALKNEIEKFGASVKITSSTLQIFNRTPLHKNVCVNTYQDHRMAMAFAPLALKYSLQINDAEVVTKSYPNFWSDFEQIGFQFTKV